MKKKENDLLHVGYLASLKRLDQMGSFKTRSKRARELGVKLCLIEPTKINLSNIKKKKNVNVRAWGEKGSLELLKISLPKIIYDRNRIFAKYADPFVKALRDEGCRFLNDPEIGLMARDKYVQFDFFKKNGIRVPNTKEYDPKFIYGFIKKGNIFIKPKSGSQGKKQIIIKYLSKDDKRIKITSTFGRKKTVIKKNIVDLKKYLKKFNLKNYIIQEGVHIDYLNLGEEFRPYDFRVIVQKSKIGKPVATIIYVRIGPSNSDQANISQGGHPQDPESVFEDYKAIINSLRKDALSAFNLLSHVYDVCDIAFDFLRDTKGRNYLIEMNARPGTKGPKALLKFVKVDEEKSKSKDVILFEGDSIDNKRREKWGERFSNFLSFPFLYAKHFASKL